MVIPGANRQTRPIASKLRRWNRKIHILVGLYLLFFLWLFALTGLFMNHVEWFRGIQPEREQLSRSIEEPTGSGPLERTRDLMQQLELDGELLMGPRPPSEDRLIFRVFQVDTLVAVNADLAAGEADIRVVQRSWPQILGDLHTFTGVRRVWNEPLPAERDWWPTTLWAIAIDATALGVIALVISAIYMWLQLAPKRVTGLIALSLGTLCCAFFLWGLRWIF